MQFGLFDPPKARATDPATSHEAAAHLPLTELRSMFLEALRAMRRATAAEIREYWELRGVNSSKAESVRKRASELRSGLNRGQRVKPLIRVVGDRRCNVTGNKSQVYEVCE